MAGRDDKVRDERYQVSDPSVLYEDVWAEEGEDGAPVCADPTRKCPTCGLAADLAEIRCPRCNTLLLTSGCSGSCGTCGQRTCTGEKRR